MQTQPGFTLLQLRQALLTSASSHASSPSSTPLPQFLHVDFPPESSLQLNRLSIAIALEHPSPLIAFPSSQASLPRTRKPSPRTTSHALTLASEMLG